MKVNNVDVERLKDTISKIGEDISKAKKLNRIEGEWNLGDGPQFTAKVKYETGEMVLEADQPGFLGGGGTRPGPMIYCLYGSASCYAATFATLCAMEGVNLKKLRIVAESSVDFSKTFGLSDNPIAEKVRFTLYVESDAPGEKIEEIERLSQERCPAVYCLTNSIPLETEIVIE